MDDKPSPQDAIQREIDRIRIDIGVADVEGLAAWREELILLAALELAKADAELEVLYECHPQTDEWYECEKKLSAALKAARAKLYEVLK